MKKSQVSLFIIIGMILLLSSVLFISFKISLKKSILLENNIDTDNHELQFNFFRACLQRNYESSIYDFFKLGATYDLPNVGRNIIIVDYPYYFFEEKNIMPNREEISAQLSKVAKDAAIGCYVELNNSIQQNSYLEFSGMNESACQFTDKSIVIINNFQIKIGDVAVDKFRTEIALDINKHYDAINEFLDMESREEGICWSCMNDVSKKYGINIKAEQYDQETLIMEFAKEDLKWIFLADY